MTSKHFEVAIPSHKLELLNALLHRKVTKLIRYSWWSPEDTIKECQEFRRKQMVAQDVFSLTPGPLYIEFDSEIAIGINSDPSLSSVLIGLEYEKNTKKDELMCDDPEYFALDADDPNYVNPFFKAILGQELVKYEIIKKESPNSGSPRYDDLPREVALVFKFANNQELVASHGLHDDSDDFSVLQWEQVDKDVYKTLYKVSEYGD